MEECFPADQMHGLGFGVAARSMVGRIYFWNGTFVKAVELVKGL